MMYQKFEIQHRLRILSTWHPTSVQPQTTLTYTIKVFVITAFITLPYLNNHRVVHRDGNAAVVVVWIVHIDIQAEVDVVIGGGWARECRVVQVVGAACASHHAGELNDVTICDRVLAVCGVSRKTNEV